MKIDRQETLTATHDACPAATSPLLSVVIVSYNTRDITCDCLRNLLPMLKDISSEVWVVDNASNDHTIEAIQAEFPTVICIGNEDNRGFGAANNQAMRRAAGRYFLLLNSDAFPKQGAIEQLIDYLEANPKVAAVGPQLFYADGSHQRSLNAFPSPAHAWALYSGFQVIRTRLSPPGNFSAGVIEGHFISGACLMIKRSVYDRIGGFDEAFFFYMDEIDWQKRMIAQGLDLAYIPTASVVHLEGTSGSKDRLRFTLWYYVGTDYYIHKHYGIAGLVFYRLAVVLWCLRKLAIVIPHYLLHRKNLFSIRLHGFLLRQILKSPGEIGRSIPIA